MNIEVWSDFACPFCYIGKKRFEKALEKFPHKKEVNLTYKAYQLNPNAPKEMKEDAYHSFARSHNMSVEQTKKRFDLFTQTAKSVGLTYRYDLIQMTNTRDAHRLAKWANTFNQEASLTERFMHAYFTEGKNLANHETLLVLIESLGFDVLEAKNVLESDLFEDEVNNQILEGRQIGVQGVPFFVLNRKYGISGAQDEDYILQALNQLWQEQNPIQPLDSQNSGSCKADDCDI